MPNYRIHAVSRRLAEIGASAADHLAAQRQALDIVREHLRFDAGAFSTVDPATLLWTSCVVVGVDPDPSREALVFENEYQQKDLHKIADLARLSSPVGRLSRVAPDARSRSPRYQALRSAGVTDELRCALVDGNDCWGSIELYRSDTSDMFTDADEDVAAELSEDLARMIRLSLLRQAGASPASVDDPPGILVLTGSGSIEAMSPDCERWINEIGSNGQVPPAIRSLITNMPSSENGFRTATVPRRSGGWLRIHATRVFSSDGEKTSVVIEPLKVATLADTVARAYGFTVREREIITCMARGLSTKEIADAMEISPHTVNDHAKSVFRKAGVQSRQQLIATLFFDHCLPMRQENAIPGPYGWFLNQGVSGAHELKPSTARDGHSDAHPVRRQR